MQDRKTLRCIALLLTSECNLRCAYCFENAKRPGSMPWETLKTALDLARKYGREGITVLFSGGEPLLQFGLVRKAVAYTKRTFPRDQRVSFALITNGTLLTEEKVAFLARHSFEIQLSCDGVKGAQELRGKGTFHSLDMLLGRLRRLHPDFYKNNVRISMTVIPQTVRYVADSTEYFLKKGVNRIAVSPSITNHSRWNPRRIAGLEKQFMRIYRTSIAHLDQTGTVPMVHFRPTQEHFFSGNTSPRTRQHSGVRGEPRGDYARESTKAKKRSAADATMDEICSRNRRTCAADSGEILTVDVDGQMYSCVLFARSYQTLATSMLQRSANVLSLGNLMTDEFWKSRRRLIRQACQLEIFNPGQGRRSSYRSCRDCRYADECFICPVSATHLRGNYDCKRVPDFACAFNFTLLKYREKFLEQVVLPTVPRLYPLTP